MYGALAKAVATVLTYPLQVVQARANANVRWRFLLRGDCLAALV